MPENALKIAFLLYFVAKIFHFAPPFTPPGAKNLPPQNLGFIDPPRRAGFNPYRDRWPVPMCGWRWLERVGVKGEGGGRKTFTHSKCCVKLKKWLFNNWLIFCQIFSIYKIYVSVCLFSCLLPFHAQTTREIYTPSPDPYILLIRVSLGW